MNEHTGRTFDRTCNSAQATDRADELNWLAFRYVANELSGDERDAFELRLVEEQAAREAVAAAVELSQAVLLVEESAVRPAPAPRSWRLAAAWMSLGACVCLAVVFAGRFFDRDVESDRMAMFAAESPEELASLWSQTRQAGADRVADGQFSYGQLSYGQLSGEADSQVLSDVEPIAETVADMDNLATAGDDEEGVATSDLPRGTPSWMIVAVRATAQPQTGERAASDSQDTTPPAAAKAEEL